MSNVIRLIDRSRTTKDWKCPRSRYYGYEYLGRGITKDTTSLELFTGIVIHDSLAAIASFHDRGFEVPIDDIANLAFKQMKDELLKASSGVIEAEVEEFANEQATLVEGMIRGYFKHVWPRLISQYPKIIAIEKEMEFNLDPATCTCPKDHWDPKLSECPGCGGTTSPGFIFMAKPDLILEGPDGEWIYVEFKSTSWKKESWINSWETAVQLHSSIRACEATLGKAPSVVQIIGLYKGFESYGKQSSPFCYAYMKKGNPPFTEDQVQYAYKAGFKRYPTWEMKGGTEAWIDSMPDNVLADQFPMPPPVYVNDDLVDAFFRQRLIRERAIANAMLVGEFDDPVTGIDAVFPQHFDQCIPFIGRPCEFNKLCHGFVAEPLKEGFVLRTPHHQKELDEVDSNG